MSTTSKKRKPKDYTKTTVYLPGKLRRKMDRLQAQEYVSWSKIAQEAFEKYIAWKEGRINEPK